MVCLRFCQHSDVTFLKEFQQCLNSRYLTSTCLSLYTLDGATFYSIHVGCNITLPFGKSNLFMRQIHYFLTNRKDSS